jgi:hypothetical protein
MHHDAFGVSDQFPDTPYIELRAFAFTLIDFDQVITRHRRARHIDFS